MFLDSEFWDGFAPDTGPRSAFWFVAPAVILFVVPVVGLLCCLAASLVWPSREG